jgi:hypothetical protein
MKKKSFFYCLIMLVFFITLFVVGTVQAQANTFTLPWSVTGSGGMGGSAGGYTLNSTLGQPVAGMVTEGDYSLTSGFWTRVGEVITNFLTFLPLIMR